LTPREFIAHQQASRLPGRPNWTGYTGAARFATTAEGAHEFREPAAALQAMTPANSGRLKKMAEIPRFADFLGPRNALGTGRSGKAWRADHGEVKTSGPKRAGSNARWAIFLRDFVLSRAGRRSARKTSV